MDAHRRRKGLRLFRRHRIASGKAVDPVQPEPIHDPKGFAPFGVVGRQPDMAFSVASNTATCRVKCHTQTRQ